MKFINDSASASACKARLHELGLLDYYIPIVIISVYTVQRALLVVFHKWVV